MRRISLLLIAFAVVGIFATGCYQQPPQFAPPPPQQPDVNLPQPGPAPPAQNEYLQVDTGSPFYHQLPQGYPAEYYNQSQYYFYYEPGPYFYRPGVSVFLGSGWWYTPGVGMVNIGWFHPTARPFTICSPHARNRVVRTAVNISAPRTTINVTRINNVNTTTVNRPPAPPPPSRHPGPAPVHPAPHRR